MQPKIRFQGFSDDWKETKLIELIEDKPKNGYSPEAVSYKTNTKVLSISAVTTGVFDESCFKYSEFLGENEASYWVKNEDIYIQRSNTIDLVGSSAIYCGNDNEYIYPDLLMKIHAKSDIDSFFLAYYLNTPKVRTYFKRHAAGTSGNMPKINQEIVMNVPVCVPSIKEQKEISLVLKLVDSEIQNEKKQILTLNRQKNELVRRILKREICVNNNASYPDWNVVKLSEVLTEKNRRAVKDGKYEHVSLTKEGVIPKSERYERDFLVTTEDKEYKITHVDDICYNPANLKFGVICRNKYKIGIFSPIYITFKVNEGYLPEFIEIVVTNKEFIAQALKYQEGTVYERMAVKPADLLGMSIKVPCLDEQREISSIIGILDDAIKTHFELCEKWEKVKKGLLQQMFI